MNAPGLVRHLRDTTPPSTRMEVSRPGSVSATHPLRWNSL